jgi:uncharacterized iron-regulated protein
MTRPIRPGAARLAAFCALVVTTVGCATGGPGPATPPEHPLNHRIWDARSGQFVSQEQFLDAAAGADHVLLGEVHVNPYHHAAQESVLAALVARGRRPAVVFEMMERDQQPGIDALRAARRPTADELAEATGFSDSGWDWPLYRPLVALALEHELPILAGNAPIDETRALVKDGVDSIEPERWRTLGLDRPLAPAAQVALVDIMVQSHCGHAPGDYAERLVEAQRLRDATMAEVMLGAAPAPTVLITGSGHARRDFGVPLYLEEWAPDARLLTLRLVEVDPGAIDPADYRDTIVGLPRPFDYLWFTPALERPDPCEEFRKGLERMREQASQSGENATALPN